MGLSAPVMTTTVTVFTRHTEDCPKQDNPQWKRCECRKYLYIYENGIATRVSAKTRSWEEAEKIARAEMDKRDPVRIELERIADQEKKKVATLTAVDEALDQWVAGMKGNAVGTVESYRSTAKKVKQWAARHKLVYVSDVTPMLLDKWRAQWSPESDDTLCQMAQTTQSNFLSRLKQFFTWATGLRMIVYNPTLALKTIGKKAGETWPLTPKQFEEVLQATYLLDNDVRLEVSQVGVFLRAIFLVQRWTGLRVGDVLKLSKRELIGNRLTTRMQKTSRPIECILPDEAMKALASLPQRREEHPDYFFWSAKGCYKANVARWLKHIRRLNEYLYLKNENGEPLDFHSHMLRDTFAVEMLLVGVPLEKVSKLLGHSSVATTERYYTKWVKARLRQLEDVSVEAMRKMGATVTLD